MIKAAIFDMDGTILDTVEDLTAALNHAMVKTGHRHDFEGTHTRLFFGSGARVAVIRALAAEKGMEPEELIRIGTGGTAVSRELEDEAEIVLPEFQKYYPSHSEICTRPYEGVPEMIRELREKGIRTAVVSNKMDRAVQGLCQRYFDGLFDAAVGENEPRIRRKPAPDMTLKTMQILGVTAEEAVYVGDSEVDIETARNAGLTLAAVAWGFRSKEFLMACGAETVAEDPAELFKAILSAGTPLETD